MPKRFSPTIARGVTTPPLAAEYARQNLQLVADALATPLVHDWGAHSSDLILDAQVADVNLITLGGTIDLTLKTGAVPDRTTVRLFVTQDATGSRTVTWAGVTWLDGFTPILQTAAAARDLFEFTYIASAATWLGRHLTGKDLQATSVAVAGGVTLRGATTYPGGAADVTVSGSVANGGTIAIGDNASFGLAIIVASEPASAIVFLAGMAPAIVNAIVGTWGTVIGAANNYNVYGDGTNYRIENRSGAARSFYVYRIGSFATQ